MFNKFFNTILLLSIIGFVIAVYALLMQVFGISSVEKATIISGLLSMIGGSLGAFGAYFIARMQMTKQLDLQYKKEEEKMIKEVKINNYLKLLEIGDNLLQLINKLYYSLIEIYLESIASKENVVELEKDIRIIVQEIKEQSTKVVIYKVFFDDRVLMNFPDLPKVTQEMEQLVYLKLIDFRQTTHDKSDLIENEKFDKLTDEIRKEFDTIINRPKEDIFKILSYTNLYLKNSIEK